MKLPDPRNKEILVGINDDVLPRNEARVSVFDSVVQGGDAVWEGLRVYDGRIAAFESNASDLVKDDGNTSRDIFTRGPLR